MTKGLLTYRVINDEVPAASGGHATPSRSAWAKTPPAETTESGKPSFLRGGGRLKAGVAVTHAWFQLGKGIFTGAFLSSQPFTTRGEPVQQEWHLVFRGRIGGDVSIV